MQRAEWLQEKMKTWSKQTTLADVWRGKQREQEAVGSTGITGSSENKFDPRFTKRGYFTSRVCRKAQGYSISVTRNEMKLCFPSYVSSPVSSQERISVNCWDKILQLWWRLLLLWLFIKVMVKLILEVWLRIVPHNTIRGPELGGGRREEQGWSSSQKKNYIDILLTT